MKKSLIVWKLCAVFAFVTFLVYLTSGYLMNLVDEHHALESTREIAQLNTDTILQSLRAHMMTHDDTGIDEFIGGLARSNPIYRDISLISHEGKVVASKRGATNEVISQNASSCRTCHGFENPVEGLGAVGYPEVKKLDGGERFVSVFKPIFNEKGCSTADCHAADASGQILGFLKADLYFIPRDTLTIWWNLKMTVAVIAVILLSTALFWFAIDRLLGRPVRKLIAGMKKVANNDFSVVIDVNRNDEMGQLARSFNEMTSQLARFRRELQETTYYMEGIIESSADIIITVNRDGLIQTFNQGAERTLGYSRYEVLGKRIEILFADPKERDAAIARLKDKDNVPNWLTHFVTKTGEVRDVMLTLTRLRNREGRAIGTFGISKDITKEKRLQRKLIQAERLTAVGHAFTGTQHAMKNMLNGMKGGSYMMDIGFKNNDMDMAREGMAMVQEGIIRLTDLSLNMLKFVKDRKPELEETDLREMLSKICKTMKQTVANKGIKMRYRIAEDLPRAMCDLKQIHSAIMDILSNAVDACLWKEYEGGEYPDIFIKAYPNKANGHGVIEIRDNGCGMTKEIQTRIFTPFFSTKKKHGTGLGLALTARVIELHGGTIDIESKPDEGASFTVKIPSVKPT